METILNCTIKKIKEQILTMITLSTEAIQNSIQALSNHDKVLSQQIMDNDVSINQLEIYIETESLRAMALYQPEAADLRFIVGVLRMVTDIERIGDLAVNIAKSVQGMDYMCDISMQVDLPYLAKLSLDMLNDAVDALVTGNIALAEKVIGMDDLVDQLYNQIFRELLVSMMENPLKISQCVQYLLVSRHLERVGDHATNIAESVIFILQGVNRKHYHKDQGIP